MKRCNVRYLVTSVIQLPEMFMGLITDVGATTDLALGMPSKSIVIFKYSSHP